jgi:hypothetical protein
LSNCRPISVLSNFSKLFQFIIHEHVSHYAKFNSDQRCFTRTKSAVTNFVTFHDVWPLLSVVSVKPMLYIFYLSNAFDLVPHNMLLHKLGSFASLILMLAGFAVT